MRRAGWLIVLFSAIPLALSAGETPLRQEYAEFSRVIHKMAVKQLPKEFVDASGWGQTIPAPANLSLKALRTFVKVGDKLEVPHGAWRRFRGKIEDPDKNLKIVVKEFKKLDDNTYRIVADVDATLWCQAEWRQWQKGLLLISTKTEADVNFTAAIVCDVGVSLNLKKFPPELNIAPKVTDLGLNLVDFQFRGGGLIKGEKANGVGNDLKDLMRSVVKASEPLVKEYANQAIAQSLKEGKGTISADAIMKALSAPKK